MPSATPLPDGPYTAPLYKLAQMVSECAAFQTRAGLTYPDVEAEAKLVNGDGGMKRIHYPALEGEDWLDKLPCAIITWGDDWQLAQVSGGARNYFHNPTGEMTLELIDVEKIAQDGAQGRLEAAARDFGNFVGRVLSGASEAEPGIAQLAALNDRLAISLITQVEKPGPCERVTGDAEGIEYWSAKFVIRFGL